ncbi:MAG: HlyD family efflux transporter periplasmic adaptor subunit, partial [Acutalibacteraceae bacterium]|nr:HlyD family efflux transporter periplasmic adaptor subunit [Acutalibacteraceae bacterium]
MIKDRKWLNMICIVIIVAVMVYLFQDVFKTNMNKYETEIAEEVTVQDTVNLDAFIVRDEQYIREATDDKTIVPLVSDGDRVASGDAVARICKQEQDAVDYAELEESKKIRDRYVRLNEQTELDALDMQKLNKDIDSAYTDFLKLISSKNYNDLDNSINNLEDSLASKQVLRDGTIDINSKIEALDKRIAELEAKKISAEDVP